MNNSSVYINLLLEAVEKEFGGRPASPSDFDRLSAAVFSKNNEHVAVSTLKRIWGYIKNSHRPTFSTLSVLARYAGFRDWDAFIYKMEGRHEPDSDFFKEELVVAAQLPVGIRIRVEINKDKWCEVRKIADTAEFEVVECRGMKLLSGDRGFINTLCPGDKFLLAGCRRGERYLGNYIGARKEGISKISFIG